MHFIYRWKQSFEVGGQIFFGNVFVKAVKSIMCTYLKVNMGFYKNFVQIYNTMNSINSSFRNNSSLFETFYLRTVQSTIYETNSSETTHLKAKNIKVVEILPNIWKYLFYCSSISSFIDDSTGIR